MRLADLTGGRATYQTNDFTIAYARAQRDLGCRYTLGFYDKRPAYDRWHQVRIDMRRSGLRAIHQSAYEFLSPEEKSRSVVQAAFLAPTMFEGSIVRAKIFPVRPLTDESWQGLLAIEFPVPLDPLSTSPTEREFGAVLRKGTDVVHSFSRKITIKARGAGAPTTRTVSFLEPVTVRPGDHEVTVVMSEPGGKTLNTARVAARIPKVPLGDAFLVGPFLGTRGAGGVVVKGSGLAAPDTEPQRRGDSTAAEPESPRSPDPAAGDRVGSKASFQPLLIHESDRRAPIVARTEACVVHPRGKPPEQMFVRTLSGEDGTAIGSIAPESLRFGAGEDVQCRSYLDIIPVATLPPGEYSFEAALDPRPRKDPGPSRTRFLLRDEESGEDGGLKGE